MPFPRCNQHLWNIVYPHSPVGTWEAWSTNRCNRTLHPHFKGRKALHAWEVLGELLILDRCEKMSKTKITCLEKYQQWHECLGHGSYNRTF